MLNVSHTSLKDVYLIEHIADHDIRGVERAGFHPTQYAAFGMTGRFASDRYVRSFQGALRGLYVLPADQSMLFTLIRGDVCLVVADVREGSRQFGKFQMIDITEAQNKQVYISAGFAYGYCVRSDTCDVHEKYTGMYDASVIEGLFWRDASLNIPWPVKFPLVSEAENHFPGLKHKVCVD